ncbi:hypothetical protein GF396_02200 [Candidatus Pacearchaeota archaeon]|nr:hypothetical protein [Candidatus Pacearchaeota archaeon]
MRRLISLGLASILGISAMNAEASRTSMEQYKPSFEFSVNAPEVLELEELLSRVSDAYRDLTNYDLWERTTSAHKSETLETSASYIKQNSGIAKSLMNSEELQDYENFWKTFDIDKRIVQLYFEEPSNKEYLEKAAETLAIIWGIQERYGGDFSDFENLTSPEKEGERIVIYWHCKHRKDFKNREKQTSDRFRVK